MNKNSLSAVIQQLVSTGKSETAPSSLMTPLEVVPQPTEYTSESNIAILGLPVSFTGMFKESSQSEFTFDDNKKILLWHSMDQDRWIKLANFELVVTRRIRLVARNGEENIRSIMIRGRTTVYMDVKVSEFSYILQKIERQSPEYYLYPDSRQSTCIFRRYVAEVYNKAEQLPLETVYQYAGWNETSTGQWHYYSGREPIYCWSDFQLANARFHDDRTLVSWAEKLLSIGSKEIMLPLLIHAHLGYTLKLFEEAGYHEQYILAMVGMSGSKKTSLARVMFCLFGGELINFTSTDRAIELELERRQDSTLVLDDLSSGNDNLLTGKLEKVIRQLGDSTGRKRSINGGTAQDEVRTRCAVVLTAETDINALSKSSKLRTLVVYLGLDSLNSTLLSQYQQDAVAAKNHGQFSKLEQYMTLYIEFLERNYIKIVEVLKTEKDMLLTEEFTFSRQATIFKIMRSQLKLILDFWHIYSGVPYEQFGAIYRDCMNVLMTVLKANEQRGKTAEPYVLFLQAIAHGLTTGGVIAPNKDCLDYGIGYRDRENVILKADLAYEYVFRYYSKQGKQFSESPRAILNQLYELNLIDVYKQNEHKPKLLKQITVNGSPQHVICLKWRVIEQFLLQTTSADFMY